MATQEQVNHLQQQLISGETPYKNAVSDILASVADEASISPQMRKAIVESAKALRRQMIAFHALSAAVCIEAGVQPLSGGQDKDEGDD